MAKYKKPPERDFDNPQWLDFREGELDKHGRRCMRHNGWFGWFFSIFNPCRGPLQVDHVESYARRPDRELDPENSQILCRKHNLQKGWRSARDYRPRSIWQKTGYWVMFLMIAVILIFTFDGLCLFYSSLPSSFERILPAAAFDRHRSAGPFPWQPSCSAGSVISPFRADPPRPIYF